MFNLINTWIALAVVSIAVTMWGYVSYLGGKVDTLQGEVKTLTLDNTTCHQELVSSEEIAKQKIQIVNIKRQNEMKVEEEIPSDEEEEYSFTASPSDKRPPSWDGYGWVFN